MKIKTLRLTKLKKYIPEIAALVGATIYIIQAIYNTQFQLPNLDEGAYLFKGYHFALKNYQPFQINGFWTNKMYLSFFIWGWIQVLFSPGLFAPRVFAILFGFLSLVGTWIIVRRMGNRWMAALAVLTLALNPTLIGIYALANSQVIVIFLLTWILVLTLGPYQPRWQILLGAFLSGILVFVRENLLLLVPLLIAYIFWQNGKKTGFLALGISIIVLAIGHILYWPEITYLWVRQIPNITAFLTLQSLADTNSTLTSSAILSRIHSFSVALRTFLVPFTCLLGVLIFWPKKHQWKSADQFHAGWFLLVTYILLLVSHLWTALGNDYCVYCATTYLAFFSNLGLILFATCYSSFSHNQKLHKQIIGIITIPIFISGIWYSWFEKIGLNLMEIQVPRFSAGKILPGTSLLWQILQNKFELDMTASRQLLPAVFGLVSGLLLILTLFLVFRWLGKQKMNFTLFIINAFILIGILFSPLIAATEKSNYCTTRVSSLYESMGNYLEGEIKTGSIIYLDGRLTTIPLLYFPGAGFYPPQINDDNSFSTEKNSEKLLAQGKWNEELANTWRQQANFFIVGADKIDAWNDLRETLKLVEIPIPLSTDLCPESSRLFIFRRE
jgi:hypothetical protein